MTSMRRGRWSRNSPGAGEVDPERGPCSLGSVAGQCHLPGGAGERRSTWVCPAVPFGSAVSSDGGEAGAGALSVVALTPSGVAPGAGPAGPSVVVEAHGPAALVDVAVVLATGQDQVPLRGRSVW